MFSFVSDNILMVLTVLGAIISFVITFVGIVSKKPPISILAGLTVVGFTIGIAYQFYEYSEQQIEAAAQRARANIIDEINQTVHETKIVVDSIADQLLGRSLQDVGTELVNIKFTDDNEHKKIAELSKGPPRLWHTYAEQLTAFDKNTVAPTLTLTINAGHRYNSGLLLAYLLTSAATSDRLKSVVEQPNRWDSFSAEEDYIRAFASGGVHIEWVLFYDATTQGPVAYADARAFTQELMVHHRLKEHDKVAGLLNTKGPDTIEKLRESFPSIQTSVFETDSPAELVKIMINEQLAVSLASTDEKTYVANLVHMVQLATSEQ